jgi:hypothetical protein
LQDLLTAHLQPLPPGTAVHITSPYLQLPSVGGARITTVVSVSGPLAAGVEARQRCLELAAQGFPALTAAPSLPFSIPQTALARLDTVVSREGDSSSSRWHSALQEVLGLIRAYVSGLGGHAAVNVRVSPVSGRSDGIALAISGDVVVFR